MELLNPRSNNMPGTPDTALGLLGYPVYQKIRNEKREKRERKNDDPYTNHPSFWPFLMKVFTCNDHIGFWPVGAASVIVAPDEATAKVFLEEELCQRGLQPDLGALTFVELDVSTPHALILLDGNY